MTKDELINSLGEEQLKEMSIEDSLAVLNELLEAINSDKTSLEDSFRLYENGLRLAKHAKDGIDCVEKKLRILNNEEQEL